MHHRFWKNAGILAFAEFFLKVKGLIMLPFITKYLGAVNYGVWSQVMIIVSLLCPLIFMGTEVSLVRFLPGKPDAEKRRDFSGWLLCGVATSSLICIALYAVRGPVSALFFGASYIYAPYILLAGLNIMVTALLSGIRNWYKIEGRAKPLAVMTIAQNLLQMAVLIWVLVEKRGIYDLVLYGIAADFLFLVLTSLMLIREGVLVRPGFSWIRPYLSFGLVLLPAGYAIWILNSVDRVFLAQYHTLQDIGIYSICFTIGYTLIQVIVNPIWNMFPARASELYNKQQMQELDALLHQSIKFICWIIFPSIAGLMIVGNQLMNLLTTAEFAQGSLTISIILAGYFFLMISSYFEMLLMLNNKPYYNTAFIVAACLVNIGLNFLLIPPYSYTGAAIATMLSFLIQCGLSIVFCYRKQWRFSFWGDAARIAGMTGTMAVALLTVKLFLPAMPDLESLLFYSGAGAAIYALLTHWTKIYDFRNVLTMYREGLASDA